MDAVATINGRPIGEARPLTREGATRMAMRRGAQADDAAKLFGPDDWLVGLYRTQEQAYRQVAVAAR